MIIVIQSCLFILNLRQHLQSSNNRKSRMNCTCLGLLSGNLFSLYSIVNAIVLHLQHLFGVNFWGYAFTLQIKGRTSFYGYSINNAIVLTLIQPTLYTQYLGEIKNYFEYYCINSAIALSEVLVCLVSAIVLTPLLVYVISYKIV